ncbi:sulfite exporter TauE/SafE family protein [Sediminibacillus dalangtanensis]|uniref:Sulfite exporter TauE/SafE family protein n=1 Tax=Sediminibacillus dalangtanensis TaxID=2729421 RepID=A0ABX7VQZ3_9BACI|nr:sulfite exporter TauE/SafE family protein [Sediminibacillus dalangtanensis]QTM99061.1 sulfite exporter TauE/SafE family protein [Sediminibacillus dalangtanensis]
MYQFFSQISNWLSDPFYHLALTWEGIPLFSAFILGIVGAVAPCQFTGNIGAITIYGNRSLQEKIPWVHISLFILGKLLVFSGLGFIVWLLGSEIQGKFTYVIPWMRQAIGPLLVVMGIYMVDLFSIRWNINIANTPDRLRDNKIGSFLLGVSFTLAFCPTMFILFFMTLMPIVLSTSYGIILPSIFGLGTSVPFLLVLFLIWYFGLSGKFMKRGKKFGKVIQRVAGWLMIILGILDTLTYW